MKYIEPNEQPNERPTDRPIVGWFYVRVRLEIDSRILCYTFVVVVVVVVVVVIVIASPNSHWSRAEAHFVRAKVVYI